MAAERLGKYELVRHLASGGMASVYLARLPGLGGFERHVVLKTLRSHDGDALVPLFLDEARLAATLHHQHIAQVFEVGREDDTYFLAMEYVHGETVRQVLETAQARGRTVPLDFGVSVVCAAAAGLHHAHERRGADGTPLGIVHRDVSPSNVIASYDGSIKLIDFGIAKAALRSTRSEAGLIKGKAGYMAPEQVRGEAVDRRSDVFALGVLAYELTTQTRAFDAASPFEQLQRAARGEIVRPSTLVAGYPRALEAVIMTALAVDPDDRYPNAAALRRALLRISRELGLAVGADPVMRLLGSLFGAPPEPWLTAAPSSAETPIPLQTPPYPFVRPAPVPERIARGSSARIALAAAPAGDDDETSPISREGTEIALVDATTLQVVKASADEVGTDSVTLAPGTVLDPGDAETHELVKIELATVRFPLAAPAQTPAPGEAPGIAVAPSAPSTVLAPPAPSVVLAPPDDVPPIAPRTPSPTFAPAIALRRPRPTATTTAAGAVRPRWRRSVVGAAIVLGLGVVALVATALLPDAGAPASARAPVAATTRPAPVPAIGVSPRPPAPPAEPVTAPATDRVKLHVLTVPAGATVVLDGVRLGRTPFAAEVPRKAGGAWLKVRKRDHVAVKIRVDLEADVTWSVSLHPRARRRPARDHRDPRRRGGGRDSDVSVMAARPERRGASPREAWRPTRHGPCERRRHDPHHARDRRHHARNHQRARTRRRARALPSAYTANRENGARPWMPRLGGLRWRRR